MILDSTLRKLQVVLTTAQTTAPMSVVVDWVDNTITTFTPGVTPSLTNGTSAVDILAAPAASTQRKVNGITISNRDTVSKVVQVYLNDNGTQYSLTSSTLGVGETLGYTDTQGWYTIDTSGARKGVGASGATGSQGIQGVSGFHGWDGDNGEDAIPIPGPRGLQGIQGPPGPQGRTIIMLDDSDHGDPFPMGGGSTQASTPASSSVQNGFINYLINGDMGIYQRGTTAVTAGYGPADRWTNSSSGTSMSSTLVALSSGDTLYDTGEARQCTQIVVTSVANVANYATLSQYMEDVRHLAGKTVTVSFWAKAAAGTPSIGLEISQNFGTGGSAQVDIAGQAQVISTTWTRYSKTFVIPNLNAKTIGTEATHYTRLNFWLDAGSNWNARSGSIGQSSKTVSITLVQLEVGSTMSQFEVRPKGVEIALCQRYYEKSYDINTNPGTFTDLGALAYRVIVSGVGPIHSVPVTFQVAKRVAPTITFYNPHVANANWRNSSKLTDSGPGNASGLVNISSQGFVATNAQVAGDLAPEGILIQWTAQAEF